MPRNHDEEPDWDNDEAFDLEGAIERADLLALGQAADEDLFDAESEDEGQ